MRSSLTTLTAAAQSVKAQALSTLMASLDAVQGVSATSGTAADSPQASLQSAEAQVKATVVAVDSNGKAVLEVAGTKVEAQLPLDLLKAGAKNPDLLKPGAQLRLPADIPARVLPGPATQVEVHGPAGGTAVGPAGLLASPFPPGSLGAAISRLAGLALPGAEPAVTGSAPLPAPPATAPTLRPGMVTHAVQPEILTALAQAAGRQVPLAQGLNFLLALPPEALQSLPAGVQDIVKALAQLRNQPADLAAPETLAKAVAQSGTFLEAALAQGGTTGPDFKALLLNLKALVGTPAPLPPASTGGGLAHAAALLLGEPETPPAPAAPAAAPEMRARPGEAPPAPRLADVQRAVDGALERIKLSQLASLPEHPEMRVTDDRAQPLRLAVSLPLAPQGHDRPATAVMGMVIEHQPLIDQARPQEVEERDANPETEGFPWKVRIALDLEETGPVQAEIALRGQSVGVTFWAERTEMAQAARAEIGALHRALTQAAFDVVNLEVKDGFPHARAVPHAPVLDRRT